MENSFFFGDKRFVIFDLKNPSSVVTVPYKDFRPELTVWDDGSQRLLSVGDYNGIKGATLCSVDYKTGISKVILSSITEWGSLVDLSQVAYDPKQGLFVFQAEDNAFLIQLNTLTVTKAKWHYKDMHAVFISAPFFVN